MDHDQFRIVLTFSSLTVLCGLEGWKNVKLTKNQPKKIITSYTLKLDESQWPASRSGHFTSHKKHTGYFLD
jgi:hypothetical protein